jgi:3-oxoacyl-[acyl-carrier-protein] synthase II
MGDHMNIPGDARARVVATGLGVVSPVGLNVADFWTSVAGGRSGLTTVTSLETDGYGSAYGGEVNGFDFDTTVLPDANCDDRTIHFALGAAGQALAHSLLQLDDLDRERFGVVLGTCMGGMRSGEEWHRQLITKGYQNTDHSLLLGYQFDSATNALSARHRLYGPKTTISTACAAGANAIGYASDLIRFGKADYMLAGGSDSLAHLAYAGFSSLQSLGTEPCSPYSKGRSGLTLGEGAGVVVLERLDLALARGARIFAEILGYGLSVDGYHPTAPHPQGDGAARAIRAALKAGGIQTDRVGYVNGHGTGTPKNDSAETNALKSAFGEQAHVIPVSSTKSMVGHSLGAAGAVEGITTILALHHQYVPPTINYQEPDPGLDLDYTPNVGHPAEFGVAISNSFAFGGNNAVVVYGRSTDNPPTAAEEELERVVVTGLGVISAAGLGKEALWSAVRAGSSLVGPIAGFDPGDVPVRSAAEIPSFDSSAYVSPKQARRMDLASRYAVVTSKMALSDAGLTVDDANRDRIGVVAGTGNGPAQAATSFHRPLVEEGPQAANPAIFPNTVFNAAAGQVAIHLGLHGCTTTVTAERSSSATSLTYAFDLLRRGRNDAIICFSVDELDASTLAGYNGFAAASDQPRPFGLGRDGFAASGGAVALVLETLGSATARGAAIYGEIVGYGMTSDAVPSGRHDLSGVQAGRAMSLALAEAGLESGHLDYICASASGSRGADLVEARGIRLALGADIDRVPVSSIKGVIGEPWGAGAGMGAVAGLLAIRDGIVPPTAGLEKAGPGCELNHVTGGSTSGIVNTVMVNSVACGGNNISLVLRRYHTATEEER